MFSTKLSIMSHLYKKEYTLLDVGLFIPHLQPRLPLWWTQSGPQKQTWPKGPSGLVHSFFEKQGMSSLGRWDVISRILMRSKERIQNRIQQALTTLSKMNYPEIADQKEHTDEIPHDMKKEMQNLLIVIIFLLISCPKLQNGFP